MGSDVRQGCVERLTKCQLKTRRKTASEACRGQTWPRQIIIWH